MLFNFIVKWTILPDLVILKDHFKFLYLTILFLTKVFFTRLNGFNTQTSDKITYRIICTTCILRQEIRQRMSECGLGTSRARTRWSWTFELWQHKGISSFQSQILQRAAIGYPLKIAPSIQFSVFEGIVLMDIFEQVVLF